MRPTASPHPAPVLIRPGAFHLPGFLSPERQAEVLARCLALAEAPAGFYRPVLRTGARMRLDMLCLGRHWDARTYRYGDRRTDVDGLPVPGIPAAWLALAGEAANAVGMRLDPDVVLVNRYDAGGRLGLHQDRDERPATLEAGVPVVSLSLGLAAEFLFGGPARRDGTAPVVLASGDAFVFGGPARLCHHGVRRVLPGTAPAALGLDRRLCLTFRQY